MREGITAKRFVEQIRYTIADKRSGRTKTELIEQGMTEQEAVIFIEGCRVKATEQMLKVALFETDGFFNRYYFPHKEYSQEICLWNLEYREE